MSDTAVLQSIARLVPEGARVLDLGCGDGALLDLLQRERGCSGYGIEIAADLYTAVDLDRSVPHPALVIGPPHGGVKEQRPGVYASELARRGFVTLAFWGFYFYLWAPLVTLFSWLIGGQLAWQLYPESTTFPDTSPTST